MGDGWDDFEVGQGGRNFAQNTKEGGSVIPKVRVDVLCAQALTPPWARGHPRTMENTAFLCAGKVTAVSVKHAQGSPLTKKY